MLFNSLVFLYIFLPITLLVYYLVPRIVKNYFLLFASLVFFAWGGVSLTLLLLVSILMNYFFGLGIGRNAGKPLARTWMAAGVAANVLFLGIFKYTNFIVENLNLVLSGFELQAIPQTSIVLPIGISFYTFHALSYLVDIYRQKTAAQKNIFYLALYICMFSQLIAGPIIRYSDVAAQLTERNHHVQRFASGVLRFAIGLAKKVLFANTFAATADAIFAADTAHLGAPAAWLGIIAYAMQIYCDFSGYSDMAIGLGRMFGFEFMENFNFPYVARSVKEFWRRWHISLSSFFRDYVYIPLGGNRVTVSRTYINLLIVFFLTGFWHGASWTFVIWGLFHGFFMVIERLGWERFLEKMPAVVANAYTMLVVLMAWVLFRADSLSIATGYWGSLFDFDPGPEQLSLFFTGLSPELLITFLVAIPGAYNLHGRVWNRVKPKLSARPALYSGGKTAAQAFAAVLVIGILLLCTLYMVAGSYNPFIYYRF